MTEKIIMEFTSDEMDDIRDAIGKAMNFYYDRCKDNYSCGNNSIGEKWQNIANNYERLYNRFGGIAGLLE